MEEGRLQPGRRLDGGLGEAELPPVREKRNKLSRPPCKGETGQRSDDEREEAPLGADQRERASDADDRRGSSLGRPAGEPRELTMSVIKEREARENH